MIRRTSLPKRTSRPRKRRKTPRAKLEQACDALWSKIVRASNGGRCWFLGKLVGAKVHAECTGALQGMHGISRRYRGTRWNLDNGIPGCQAAHTYYTHREGEWDHWLVSYWGLEKYNALWSRAMPISKPDLESIHDDLSAAWEMVGGGE